MENEARSENRLPIFEFIHSLDNTESEDETSENRLPIIEFINSLDNTESEDETKEINVIVKEKQYRDQSRSKSFDADSTDDSTQ